MKTHKSNFKHYRLTIGWLYPQLMSTYGDRGNIISLQKRCKWRDIEVEIISIDETTHNKQILTVDLFFAGGAQDIEQGIVINDLREKKSEFLKEMIENNVPALFVCGAPQLMGKWYEPAVGEKIAGIGIFDITTKHPGLNKGRLVGNIVAKINWQNLDTSGVILFNSRGKRENRFADYEFIVGFENHGGRTKLGPTAKPFAKVIKGFGNNGEDKTEGVIYKNAIGCYFHGPLLPKNPHLTDFLIAKALNIKYKEAIELRPLDDTLEWQAHEEMIKRLGIKPT
jgi:CobQ-like glutamine amidotransferase family enzyme